MNRRGSFLFEPKALPPRAWFSVGHEPGNARAMLGPSVLEPLEPGGSGMLEND